MGAFKSRVVRVVVTVHKLKLGLQFQHHVVRAVHPNLVRAAAVLDDELVVGGAAIRLERQDGLVYRLVDEQAAVQLVAVVVVQVQHQAGRQVLVDHQVIVGRWGGVATARDEGAA
jgi:hypothetical protein